MRLDKFLKVSRIIKRRTIAKEVADKGRVFINDRPAKSSTSVTVNDIIKIQYGNKTLIVRVLELQDSTKKDDAKSMFEILEEQYHTNKETTI